MLNGAGWVRGVIAAPDSWGCKNAQVSQRAQDKGKPPHSKPSQRDINPDSGFIMRAMRVING
jgi:hypothetical protein